MVSTLKVLVATSGSTVKMDEGKVFHCLAGSKNVWHTPLKDVGEMYAETHADKWDAVIINAETPCVVSKYVADIHRSNPAQPIIIVTEFPERMYASVLSKRGVMCVPIDNTALEKAIKCVASGGSL